LTAAGGRPEGRPITRRLRDGSVRGEEILLTGVGTRHAGFAAVAFVSLKSPGKESPTAPTFPSLRAVTPLRLS
jgi:hypothetical protein